jgi:hypothetical protein
MAPVIKQRQESRVEADQRSDGQNDMKEEDRGKRAESDNECFGSGVGWKE